MLLIVSVLDWARYSVPMGRCAELGVALPAPEKPTRSWSILALKVAKPERSSIALWAPMALQVWRTTISPPVLPPVGLDTSSVPPPLITVWLTTVVPRVSYMPATSEIFPCQPAIDPSGRFAGSARLPEILSVWPASILVV